MRDEFSLDHTRWAQFSDDDVMRYHLVYAVSENLHRNSLSTSLIGASVSARDDVSADLNVSLREAKIDITTFVMCNPSKANAFKHDPTVGECLKFTRRWGSDVCWVVNLWAFRSPYPAELFARPIGERGDDAANDRAIMQACQMASRVIVAWGNMGTTDRRWRVMDRGGELYCLGTTQDGSPKHPLARGKHRIPGDTMPRPWRAPC